MESEGKAYFVVLKIITSTTFRSSTVCFQSLLVQGLGVGGSAGNVGIAGSLVGAGGELELVGRLQVGIAGGAVGGSVVTEVEEESEHLITKKLEPPRYSINLGYISYVNA